MHVGGKFGECSAPSGIGLGLVSEYGVEAHAAARAHLAVGNCTLFEEADEEGARDVKEVGRLLRRQLAVRRRRTGEAALSVHRAAKAWLIAAEQGAVSEFAMFGGGARKLQEYSQAGMVQHMEMRSGMRPVHPGEILREEIEAADVSKDALAKALDVPLDLVTDILGGTVGIASDTALRLARYFGTTPQLWLNLQQTWELRRAEIELGGEIAKQVTPRKSAA